MDHPLIQEISVDFIMLQEEEEDEEEKEEDLDGQTDLLVSSFVVLVFVIGIFVQYLDHNNFGAFTGDYSMSSNNNGPSSRGGSASRGSNRGGVSDEELFMFDERTSVFLFCSV